MHVKSDVSTQAYFRQATCLLLLVHHAMLQQLFGLTLSSDIWFRKELRSTVSRITSLEAAVVLVCMSLYLACQTVTPTKRYLMIT